MKKMEYRKASTGNALKDGYTVEGRSARCDPSGDIMSEAEASAMERRDDMIHSYDEDSPPGANWAKPKHLYYW